MATTDNRRLESRRGKGLGLVARSTLIGTSMRAGLLIANNNRWMGHRQRWRPKRCQRLRFHRQRWHPKRCQRLLFHRQRRPGLHGQQRVWAHTPKQLARLRWHLRRRVIAPTINPPKDHGRTRFALGQGNPVQCAEAITRGKYAPRPPISESIGSPSHLLLAQFNTRY